MVVQPLESVLPTDPLTFAPSPAMQHRPSAPLIVPVLSNLRLTPADYVEDVRHVVFDLRGTGFTFAEGQSIGILPPGIATDGRPHRLRLFTIACPAEGEPGYSRALSVCVKRVVFESPEQERRVGICSNYLCDLKPGETVRMSGPNGKHFALPSATDTDLLFFATGTGIAPFRAFLMRIFSRPEPRAGSIHLFYGSRTRHDHVFANAINDDILQWTAHPNFFLHSALSREDPHKRNRIGQVLTERSADIEHILDRRNFAIYICGIQGMEKEIEHFFRRYLQGRTGEHIDDGQWAAMKAQLKQAGRWEQEVY